MAMPKLIQSLFLASCAALGACASTTGETSEEIENEARRTMIENQELMTDQEKLITRLGHLRTCIADYARLRGSTRSAKDETEMLRISNYLSNQMELHYDEYRQIAEDPSRVYNREFVVATLGFSDEPEVLSDLMRCAFTDEDPAVRANAVFALGLKASPKTPTQPLMRLIENLEADNDARAGAAWTMVRIQERKPDPSPILEFWKELLRGPIDSVDDMVTKNAIEGLGHARDAQYREVVERYAKHPSPPVRYHVAIALSRILDERSIPVLIGMLKPADPNPNVRLAVRKALQAMAGNADFGENAEEWKKHFARG